MKSYEFSPKRQLENFAEIQYKILKSGYPLESHLKTIKELPKESRLRHYERLFQEKWINEEQYKKFMQEEHYSTLRIFSKNWFNFNTIILIKIIREVSCYINMITQEDLDKAEKIVRGERGYVALIKYKEKEFKKCFGIGLGVAGYLGVRKFIGPEIDLNLISPTILQVLDSCAVFGSVALSVVCGPAYGIYHLIRKKSEKDLKNAESKLEKLSGAYEFEGESN